MRAFRIAILFIATSLVGAGTAMAGPLDNCELRSKVDTRTPGRVIYKPSGAHFNQAVIVAARRYYPTPPEVKLFTFELQPIEIARLKSDGRCSGNPECLFAATYLTRRNGQQMYRRYGALVIIRFMPRRITSKTPCTYIQINPRRRAEFRG